MLEIKHYFCCPNYWFFWTIHLERPAQKDSEYFICGTSIFEDKLNW
jgi:hypothetical protein